MRVRVNYYAGLFIVFLFLFSVLFSVFSYASLTTDPNVCCTDPDISCAPTVDCGDPT